MSADYFCLEQSTLCLQTISVSDSPHCVCRLFLFGTVHAVSADYFCLGQSTLCLQTISVGTVHAVSADYFSLGESTLCLQTISFSDSPHCVCRLF
ncbi:hypothetical protein DPMN_066987 [Dreissena polymorpha]|uniref:Uncharacterized protein n=1 Tax=Dreissena polymorpha TaxID=45954 RepID=A0A9D3YZG3_DREPO|nr:hypothetical protein DPMN_066987 [Dreissena polymorpha]